MDSHAENVQTPSIKNTLTPEFKHSKVIQISKVKKKHLEFFESKSICFHVYGTQEDTVPDPKLLKLTTRVRNLIDSKIVRKLIDDFDKAFSQQLCCHDKYNQGQ